MNNYRKKILVAILCFIPFLGIIYSIYIHRFYLPVSITVDAQVTHADTFQLFYNTGKGFNEKESILTPVPASNEFQTIVFTIPASPEIIQALRIDPGSTNSSIAIKKISLNTSQNSFTWKPDALLNEFSFYFDISSKKIVNDSLVLEITGKDPQFSYSNKLATHLNLKDLNSSKRKTVYVLAVLFLYTILFLNKKRIFDLVTIALISIRSLKIMHDRDVRLTVIFIILLCIPLSQMIFRYLPESAAYEKRTLAIFPNSELLNNVSTWRTYVKSFETFFNDHYGLRSLLARTDSLFNIKLFKIAPKSEVIIGKNGWLFFGALNDGPSQNFSDYYGNVLFTEQELTTIKKNILNLQTKLSQQHTDLLFVLAPNKQTIYGEYLPTSISSKKGTRTRADQLDELAKEISINFIDTRQALLNAKTNYPYPLYYKTDTHWNELGSFVAYQEIVKNLKHMGHRISDVYENTTPNLTSTPGSMDGGFTWNDLAEYINIKGDLFKDTYVHVKKHIDFTPSDNLRSNKPIITTLPNTHFSKAVIFRDSFSIALIPYLSETFSRAVYIWDHTIDYDIIKKEKPDIVIFEFVERFSNKLLDIGTNTK